MVDKQKFIKPSIDMLHDKDMQHIELTIVSIFFIDHGDISFVENFLRQFETFSPEVLDRLLLVIVDDGSTVEYQKPKTNLNITWLKIQENIPWNFSGAKNLGVVYAKSDKVLITDMDFKYPEQTIKYLIHRNNPGFSTFYKIRIRDSETLKVGKAHSSNFFISRGLFLRYFGFDEEFAGGYGAEDYRYVKFMKYHGNWQRNLPKKYYCERRHDKERKGSDHSLIREFSRNTPIDRRKRSELLYWGSESGHSRMFLNFEWKVVFNQKRYLNVFPKKPYRLWKHLWIFRTLLYRIK